MNSERKGEILVIISIFTFALFPILASHVTRLMPPLLFAGSSTLIASALLLLASLPKRQLAKLWNKKSLLLTAGVSLFVVILPFIFIYTGASLTSANNTAVLMPAEILFTFFFVGLITREKISVSRIIGGILVAVGAVTVVFNGGLVINWGDILIITGTAFFPIGNIFAKKALSLMSPAPILFGRSFLGGIALVGMSLIFEEHQVAPMAAISGNIDLILINAFLVHGISKLIWYSGFKYLDISKAIPLSASFPALSLVYSYFLLHEIPTTYQIAGFLIVLAGIYTLTRQAPAPQKLQADPPL